MSLAPPVRARLLGDHVSSPPMNEPDNYGIRIGVGWVLVAMLVLIIIQALILTSTTGWFHRLLVIITGHPLPPTNTVHPPPPTDTGHPSPPTDMDLKRKVLYSLPKQTCTPEDSLKFSECTICLGEFAAGEEVRVLPVCGHIYHVACIDTWLGKRSSCPLCRELLAGSAAQSGNIVPDLPPVP